MYRIDEDTWNEKYILLIPAMLDAHFPLIKYAFYSKEYHPVILSNEEHITDVGLKYVNNDMCYPIVLNAGQMIDALQSGKYDISRTRLLMPTAGDACRGANYLHVLKESVRKAGFGRVKILSLNVKAEVDRHPVQRSERGKESDTWKDETKLCHDRQGFFTDKAA